MGESDDHDEVERGDIRCGDQRQRTGEQAAVAAGDRLVGRVDFAIAIEIVHAIDGGRFAGRREMGADGDLVGRRDERVRRGVAGFPDHVAEIKHVPGDFDRHLQPGVFEGAVGPHDRESIGTAGTDTRPQERDCGCRRVGPCTRIGGGTRLEN